MFFRFMLDVRGFLTYSGLFSQNLEEACCFFVRMDGEGGTFSLKGATTLVFKSTAGLLAGLASSAKIAGACTGWFINMALLSYDRYVSCKE
jgi:hypothetical protein